jgi:hypothetical protein
MSAGQLSRCLLCGVSVASIVSVARCFSFSFYFLKPRFCNTSAERAEGIRFHEQCGEEHAREILIRIQARSVASSLNRKSQIAGGM